MPRTMKGKPHAYLRLQEAMRNAGLGEIEEALPRMVESGMSLRAIRETLSALLPDTTLPSRESLRLYYHLIQQEGERESVKNF